MIKVGDKCTVMIDTESYPGEVKKINGDTVDFLTYMGMITGIPIEKFDNVPKEYLREDQINKILNEDE